MATSSMDKSLYAAPLGIDEELSAEPAIEIQIENPDGVVVGMDGIEIEYDLSAGEDSEGEEFDSNLAEFMDEGELEKLAGDLMGDIEGDIT